PQAAPAERGDPEIKLPEPPKREAPPSSHNVGRTDDIPIPPLPGSPASTATPTPGTPMRTETSPELGGPPVAPPTREADDKAAPISPPPVRDTETRPMTVTPPVTGDFTIPDVAKPMPPTADMLPKTKDDKITLPDPSTVIPM